MTTPRSTGEERRSCSNQIQEAATATLGAIEPPLAVKILQPNLIQVVIRKSFPIKINFTSSTDLVSLL